MTEYTKYTPKERKTINHAWSHLVELARQLDRESHLNRHFKEEKRNRGIHHGTKVVILRCVKDGYETQGMRASQLFGYSGGCQWACIFGAYLLSTQVLDKNGEAVRALMEAIGNAEAADRSQRKRMIEGV